MTYANIFNDAIMPLMPEGAEQIINEQADYYSTSISWKLNNDPDRPNKRSKTIAIIISREAVEDFSEMPDNKKDQVVNRLNAIIKQKLSTFEPNHDTPWNVPGPVDKWVITSEMLLG